VFTAHCNDDGILTIILSSECKAVELVLPEGGRLTYVVANQPTSSTSGYTAEVVKRFLAFKREEGREEITIAGYASPLAGLAEHCPHWPPSSQQIRALFQQYRQAGRGKTTLNEYWTRLNTFFAFCRKQGLIDTNPMQDVPQTQKKRGGPVDVPSHVLAQVFRFIEQTINQTKPGQRWLVHERAARDLAIFRLAYATGARRRAIVALTLDDVDLDRKEVTFRPEYDKEGRGGNKPISQNAAEAIRYWLTVRPDDIGPQLFIATVGNGWNRKAGLTGTGIYRAWQRWQRRAGVEKPYTFHALRHSHITHALDKGIPVHYVSQQAGHASPDVTLRVYSHVSQTGLQKAYRGNNPDDDI